jgi:hypothetical protein
MLSSLQGWPSVSGRAVVNRAPPLAKRASIRAILHASNPAVPTQDVLDDACEVVPLATVESIPAQTS